MTVAPLLPDYLRMLWKSVESGRMTADEFAAQETRAVQRCRREWEEALRFRDGEPLEDSLITELGAYLDLDDLADLRVRCMRSSDGIDAEWHEKVPVADTESIESFYETSERVLYELVWWHTLHDDASPLAYVVALHFAQRHVCRDVLDFGAGIGSGGLLFARAGLHVTLADISSRLLQFSAWRFARRALHARFLDLKLEGLPLEAFDLITAMDVFEHLIDPIQAADRLADALRPGAFLFGRFNTEPDDERPEHIVRDFGPVFERMALRRLRPVWEDQWLWGHQAFQKQ